MVNPKDSFQLQLLTFMYDDEFPKSILMELLREKIAMKYFNEETSNFGLVNEYSPTINRKNDVTDCVNECDIEPIANRDVEELIDLGEEQLLQLSDGGDDIDWSINFNNDHNYNWVNEMQHIDKKLNNDNEQMFTVEYDKYNPTKTKSFSRKL